MCRFSLRLLIDKLSVMSVLWFICSFQVGSLQENTATRIEKTIQSSMAVITWRVCGLKCKFFQTVNHFKKFSKQLPTVLRTCLFSTLYSATKRFCPCHIFFARHERDTNAKQPLGTGNRGFTQLASSLQQKKLTLGH